MLKKNFSEEILRPNWREYLELTEKDPRYVAFIARDIHDKIVAVLRCNVANNDDRAMLEEHAGIRDAHDYFNFKTIYLLPEAQRRGIGREMLYTAITSPIASKCNKIFTETLLGYNVSSKFFDKFGAHEIGRYETDPAEHYGLLSENQVGKLISIIREMEKQKILLTIRDSISWSPASLGHACPNTARPRSLEQ